MKYVGRSEPTNTLFVLTGKAMYPKRMPWHERRLRSRKGIKIPKGDRKT